MPAFSASDASRLDAALASRLARIALANVGQEYPNHPGHLLDSPGDARTPRELHPAFYGSYDWHSSVHMHWLLAHLRRLHPALALRGAIGAVFDAHLAPRAIAGEVAYFLRAGTQSFERTYGWAWLLALATELRASADVDAARWADALQPLARLLVDRYLEYLPRAAYPIRYGTHPNSAFGLALALDHSRACGERDLASAVIDKARMWFGSDRELPAQWEPSGADFLSPSLMEAELMRRVLEGDAFAAWLDGALPGLVRGQPGTLFEPARVADRSDPQIVHLDGLNLSRAWCLRGIANALSGGDPRRPLLTASAKIHLEAGLAALDSGEYVGAHWLGSFAALALTA